MHWAIFGRRISLEEMILAPSCTRWRGKLMNTIWLMKWRRVARWSLPYAPGTRIYHWGGLYLIQLYLLIDSSRSVGLCDHLEFFYFIGYFPDRRAQTFLQQVLYWRLHFSNTSRSSILLFRIDEWFHVVRIHWKCFGGPCKVRNC